MAIAVSLAGWVPWWLSPFPEAPPSAVYRCSPLGCWVVMRRAPAAADGGLYMATPVDPVFVLLPTLERAAHQVRPAAAPPPRAGATSPRRSRPLGGSNIMLFTPPFADSREFWHSWAL